MCVAELLRALCEKLHMDRETGGLVGLLGGDLTETSFHGIMGISKAEVCKQGSAFLAMDLEVAEPLLPSGCAPFVQEGFISLTACACGTDSKFRVLKILDRLEALFIGTAGADAPECPDNTWYCDFSNCEVNVRMARFARRSNVDYDSDTANYCGSIDIHVIWCCSPCSDCS